MRRGTRLKSFRHSCRTPANAPHAWMRRRANIPSPDCARRLTCRAATCHRWRDAAPSARGVRRCRICEVARTFVANLWSAAAGTRTARTRNETLAPAHRPALAAGGPRGVQRERFKASTADSPHRRNTSPNWLLQNANALAAEPSLGGRHHGGLDRSRLALRGWSNSTFGATASSVWPPPSIWKPACPQPPWSRSSSAAAPPPGQLQHSDRSVQYTSVRYTALLKQSDIHPENPRRELLRQNPHGVLLGHAQGRGASSITSKPFTTACGSTAHSAINFLRLPKTRTINHHPRPLDVHQPEATSQAFALTRSHPRSRKTKENFVISALTARQ